ncbi:hypothetical protein AAZX31_12G084100 [Glycine max]|uniref:Sialyltransferase-like protein n=1 Tax=Glycine max TaxID=3847 RepID=I1LRF3_SOYBN|nr:beta-1,6-galactosyltransferase GALT29A [Glycine max]KAG4979958.1 hypothetical protein JHK85_033916 [Glycine max]KAG4985594.1 hypothetical protein JHK86_033285 [Glycine max]KAG5118775.1 hypothetical protein JHK82_033195 [Glycine max]KAG5139766.1 hypothetical protein JHK84_033534 [Glycine max]KAH1142305.1 hypothetical protein GYH30_033131 [Glycine max]
MKRSLRPLFLLLLIIILFAAMLTSSDILRHGTPSIDLESRVPIRHLPPPQINVTLLRHAAVEIGEESISHEIQNLLNFRHWLHFQNLLQNWFRKRRFQPGIMSELTRSIKLPIDSHNNNNKLQTNSKNKYSSCAVVGNSGILLNRDYGSEIDSHEFVIRLNNARVDHFETKVGKKTSISFMNSNILHLCARRGGCFCHPYGDRVPIVTYICQAMHFMDYTVCNASHKAPLLVTDPRFDVLCARIVKYYSLKRFVEESGKGLEKWGEAHDGSLFHYSSGMQAVMLALGICDRVSMFGFGKSTSAKHHYHTNQKAEHQLHDYEAEYAFYRDLVDGKRPIPFLEDRFKVLPVVMYQ